MEENPVARGSVTVKDLTTGEENTVDNLILLSENVDWYKANFFRRVHTEKL